MNPERLKRLGPDPMARLRRLRGDVTPNDNDVRAAMQRAPACTVQIAAR